MGICLRKLFSVGFILGSGFGRTDFSRIFIFWPPDFLRIVSPDFLSSFLWEKVPKKNPPRKSPAKSSKIYTTKIPDTFRGRANLLGWVVLGVDFSPLRETLFWFCAVGSWRNRFTRYWFQASIRRLALTESLEIILSGPLNRLNAILSLLQPLRPL